MQSWLTSAQASQSTKLKTVKLAVIQLGRARCHRKAHLQFCIHMEHALMMAPGLYCMAAQVKRVAYANTFAFVTCF